MKKLSKTKEHPLTTFRKTNEARQAVVKKSLPKAQPGGAYVAWKKGQLTRNHNAFGPTESMDTTGYSKGKKEFDFNRSTYEPGKGTTTTTTKVVRKDVPSKIAELKKGSDRTVIESKKNANKFTITEHKVKKPVSHPGNNGVTRKSGGETKSLPKAGLGEIVKTVAKYAKPAVKSIIKGTKIAVRPINRSAKPIPKKLDPKVAEKFMIARHHAKLYKANDKADNKALKIATAIGAGIPLAGFVNSSINLEKRKKQDINNKVHYNSAGNKTYVHTGADNTKYVKVTTKDGKTFNKVIKQKTGGIVKSKK